WLFDRSGSSCTAPAVAALTIGPTAATRAVTCRVADAPAASVPTAQTPVAGKYVPCDGAAADTNFSPAGNGSVTVTPVAVDGPSLRIRNVNVTSAPNITCAWSAVLVSTKSAVGCTVALAPLLLGSGSASSAWLTKALLVWADGSSTRATSVKV